MLLIEILGNSFFWMRKYLEKMEFHLLIVSFQNIGELWNKVSHWELGKEVYFEVYCGANYHSLGGCWWSDGHLRSLFCILNHYLFIE